MTAGSTDSINPQTCIREYLPSRPNADKTLPGGTVAYESGGEDLGSRPSQAGLQSLLADLSLVK